VRTDPNATGTPGQHPVTWFWWHWRDILRATAGLSPGTRGRSHPPRSHRCRRACGYCGQAVLLLVAPSESLLMTGGQRAWTTPCLCGPSTAMHRSPSGNQGVSPTKRVAIHSLSTECPHQCGLRKNACPQSYPQAVDDRVRRVTRLRAGNAERTPVDNPVDH